MLAAIIGRNRRGGWHGVMAAYGEMWHGIYQLRSQINISWRSMA